MGEANRRGNFETRKLKSIQNRAIREEEERQRRVKRYEEIRKKFPIAPKKPEMAITDTKAESATMRIASAIAMAFPSQTRSYDVMSDIGRRRT